MDEFELAPRFLTALGVGFLIGLERERDAVGRAGLRTFSLVGLLGCVAAQLSQALGVAWLLPAALLAVGATSIAAHSVREVQDEPGATTTAALLLCLCLGALAWLDHLRLTVALALSATALLQFKTELHGFVRKLQREDVVALLRLAVISLLILPVLPDRGFGPYAALNPYRIWLMVVLISGLSLGGYLLHLVVGSDRSIPMMGVLGGLVSSTATTLDFSRQVRSQPGLAAKARTVILIANLTVLVRLGVLTLVVEPGVLRFVAPALAGGLLAGSLALLHGRAGDAPQGEVAQRVGNPGAMQAALAFAALFALVTLVVAWLSAQAGTGGVYVASALSGLTDVDAISLSALQNHRLGTLDGTAAANAILIAYSASLVFKFGATQAIAGRRLSASVAAGYALVAAGMLAGRFAGAMMFG